MVSVLQTMSFDLPFSILTDREIKPIVCTKQFSSFMHLTLISHWCMYRVKNDICFLQ